MLDPWIIEEIRRREDEERRDDRPVLEVPRDIPEYPPEHEGRDEHDHEHEHDHDHERKKDEDRRGVVIVDFRV
ncbi:MAG TPA: hypothetical protein VGQ83_03125 [Polyangia bacterium]|jgi:ABC-type Zn2+ transport system substrate-binding protein/surface adhesin